MDALAAAAAVVNIATVANAPEESGQRGSSVTIGAGEVKMLDVETTAEDKENSDVHAAAQDLEDAPSKVSNAPPVLHRTNFLPPLTRWYGHTLTVRKCLCAGASGGAADEGRRHVP